MSERACTYRPVTARQSRRRNSATARLGSSLVCCAALAGCFDQMAMTDTQDMATAPVGDMATQRPRYGLVRLASTSYTPNGGSAIESSTAAALFINPDLAGAGCERRVQGVCNAYFCTGMTEPLPHAGPIQISSGAAMYTLSPRTDGTYAEFSDSSRALFLASQKFDITTQASPQGATVPSFQTSIIAGNGAYNLLMPDGNRPAVNFPLPKKSDLALRWSPLAAGKMRVELSQRTDSRLGVYIECNFDGTGGQGTVPASLLGLFVDTDVNNQKDYAKFLIGPGSTQTVTAGPYELEVVTITQGRAGTATVVSQ